MFTPVKKSRKYETRVQGKCQNERRHTNEVSSLMRFDFWHGITSAKSRHQILFTVKYMNEEFEMYYEALTMEIPANASYFLLIFCICV